MDIGIEVIMERKVIDTDVLIIGGGTAGCFAGITLGKRRDIKVLRMISPA